MASIVPKFAADNLQVAAREAAKALRAMKKVDPRDRYVLLYPNVDQARVGMGFETLNVPPAEAVYDQASDLLKFDIRKLCLSGPREELMDSFVNRSIATYVTSHATMAKLAHEKPETIQYCKAAGGIGVGFVNSLVFSNAMTFQDGLLLVRKQAKAMERAAKVVPSAKLRIRVRPATRLFRVCQAAEEHCIKLGLHPEISACSVTKRISPHVVEVGGHEEAIKYLEKEGTDLFEFRHFKRVSNSKPAYHTKLMGPARTFLLGYIDFKIESDPEYLKEPSTCSVYSATAGCRLRSVKNIKKDLCDYATKPLLVEQLLNCLFTRPTNLAQPNIFVLWDRNLMDNLLKVNRRAHEAATLLK